MNAMVLCNSSRHEPGWFLAAVLALLVHVIFAVFMFFGLNWRSQLPQGEGMVVELWQDLPPAVQPVTVKQPPEKKQPVQSEPQQRPAPKKESSPVEIAVPSPPKKPEIAREIKKEKKPQPAVEQTPPQETSNQKALEKRQQIEQAEKAEAQRLQREQELQRQRELELQQQREQEERQREQAALAAQREAQQAAERARITDEIAKYKAMIQAKVRSRIVMPPDLPGNPMVEFAITLLPGGDILDVQLRNSSGYPSFDIAVERAIFLSQPLPLPPDPTLFRNFRNLNIKVHYHE